MKASKFIHIGRDNVACREKGMDFFRFVYELSALIGSHYSMALLIGSTPLPGRATQGKRLRC